MTEKSEVKLKKKEKIPKGKKKNPDAKSCPEKEIKKGLGRARGTLFKKKKNRSGLKPEKQVPPPEKNLEQSLRKRRKKKREEISRRKNHRRRAGLREDKEDQKTRRIN